MAVRPTANVESNTPSNQGIARSTDYLKNIDPTSYYYYKLKQSGNKYLDDSMYREAASRGEADYLISLLQEREKAAPVTDLGEHAESLDAISSKQEDDVMAKWKEYGGRDYDSYIMALAIPTMDDTVKKPRIDKASGYDFGEYTDKEWALEVLNSNYQRLDAEVMEEWKKTHGFLATLTTIGTGALRVIGGAVNFLQDIANVGEGLLNMLVNWSDDSDLGARFLAAFANDGNAILDAANEIDKKYGFTIDAVQTYEQGQYVQTGFGKYFAGLTESIGYMLPSMLINIATGGAASAVTSALFYTGIASGNVKDYVASASQNGISYKDLNAGEVIANSAVKAAAQYGVEIALGKLIGFTGLDRMLGIGKGAEATWKTAGKATKPWLSAKYAMSAGEKMARGAVQTGKKAFGELALRASKSFFKEGLEESLQDLSDGLLDMMFSRQGTNLSSVNLDMAKEKIDVSNIVDSFVLGGLTSMVMGSIANLKYIAPSQRGVYMDANGEAHRMGYFQTINFNEALKTMNEWNDTVNDTNLDLQTRRDTALKMTVALKTLGSVITNMGATRALKANQILSAYASDKEKKQSVANLSAMSYATKLYDDFLQDYSLIKEYKRLVDTKEGEEVLSKIKKALGDKSDELKKAGTTKLQEAIIKNAKVTPDNSMIAESKYQMLQRALDQLGVKAIVGTDSSVVVKSEDVLFVPNQWLQDGDLSQIIQGVAYKQVEEVCLNSLTKGQQDMLKRLYKRITGIDGTMTEVMQALLFDKSFYTKVLLYSEEGTAKDRHYSHKDALQILANIGAVAKKAALIQLKNGSLSNKAYNTLMSKVRETMKTGLVVYATQYCQIDLDSAEVREILDKSEIESIRNNPNNIFTEEVNALSVDEDFSINEKKLAGARRIVNHFITMGYITPEQGLTLLMNANKGANGRFELQATIIALSISSRSESRPSHISKRLLYLLKPEYGSTFTDAITLNEFEKATGISLKSLRAGQFDELDLTPSARMYAYEMGYNLTNENDRNLFFSEMLYNVSKETLMLDEAYNLIQPLKADEIVDPKYLGPNGTAKFRRLISSIDNLKVKDILRKDIQLPEYILNTPIQYVESDTSSNRGDFDMSTQIITLTNYSTVSTLIHEVTHLTQYMSKQTTQGKGAYKAGGSLKTFKNTSRDIVQQIWKYIEKTFPTLAQVLKNKVVDGKPMTKYQLLYFVLGGEMQARLTADTELLAAGFRYKNNGRVLVAPDGTEFNLVVYSEPSIKNSNHIDYELPDTKVMADVGLNIKQMKMKATELKDKMKNSAWKYSDGTPIQVFRGATSEERLNTATVNKHGTIAKSRVPLNPEVHFWANVPEVSISYTTNDIHGIDKSTIHHLLKSAAINATADETLVLDHGTLKGWKSQYPESIIIVEDLMNASKFLKSDPEKANTIINNAIREIKIFINPLMVVDAWSYAKKQSLEETYRIQVDDATFNELQSLAKEVMKLKNSQKIDEYKKSLKEFSDKYNNFVDSTMKYIVRRFNGGLYTQEDLNTIVNNLVASNFDSFTTNEIIEATLIYNKKHPNEKIKAILFNKISDFANSLFGYHSQIGDWSRIENNASIVTLDDQVLIPLSSPDEVVVDAIIDIAQQLKQFNREHSDVLMSSDIAMDNILFGDTVNTINRLYQGLPKDEFSKVIKSIQDIIATIGNDLTALENETEEIYDSEGMSDELRYRLRNELNIVKRLNDYVAAVLQFSDEAAFKASDENLATSNNLSETNLKDATRWKTILAEIADIALGEGRYKLQKEKFERLPHEKRWKEQLSTLPFFNKNLTYRTMLFNALDPAFEYLWEEYKARKELAEEKSSTSISELEKILGVSKQHGFTDFSLKDLQTRIFTTIGDITVQTALTRIMYSTDNIKNAFVSSLREDDRYSKGFAIIDKYIEDGQISKADATDIALTTLLDSIDNFESDLENSFNYKLAEDFNISQNIIDYFNSNIKNIINATLRQATDTMAEVNPDMFKQLKIKQVKEGQKKVSTEKSYEYNTYIPNKRAKLSNLKYWMQKGKPIRMNEHLSNFIEATTPDEIYNQLPNKLKDKIAGKHAGTLKPIDIEEYVGNAGEMNDSTFKALAKYYYNNEELAKMTFAEMRELQQHIPDFAILRYLLNDIASKYTYDELMTLFKDMKDGKIKIDAEDIRKAIAEKKNVPYYPLEDDDIVTISIEGLKQKLAKRRKESYIPKSDGDVIEFSIKDLESKLKKQHGDFNPKIFGKKNAEIINKLSEKEQNALISEVSRKLTYTKSKEEKTEQFLKKTLATVRDLATTVKIQGKKGNYFREVQIEPNTTNLLFFNYFDSTLGRLETINNLAKYAQMMYEISTTARGTSASKAHDTDDDSEISAVDTATGEQSTDGIITGNNWVDRRYTGDVVDIDTDAKGVDTEELSDTFESLSRTEKMLMLEPVMYDMATKLLSKKYPNIKLTNEIINNAVDQLYDQLANYNEEQFNKFFMARTANIINANKAKVQLVAQAKELEVKAANAKTEAPDIESQKATTKNLKDGFRNRANRIIRRLSGTGLSLYNKLSNKAKEYIIAKQHPYLKSQYTFELSPNYRLLSDKELESLNTQLSADNKVISSELSKVKRAEKTQSKVDKLSQQNIKYKEKLAQREKEIERKEKLAKEAIEITEKLQKVQTMKQKVKAKKPFVIKGAKFDQKAPPLADNLLNTTWSKERMSTVQFVSNNKTENIINGKEFFDINRDAIESADLATIEDTVNWFCNVEQLPNKTLSEIRDFMGIRMLFLSYVLGESVPGGRYENISPNLKTQIENTLKADVTTAGLTLAEWQNAMKLINPVDVMKNKDIVVDGVSLPADVKNQLFDAIDSGSIKDVKAAMEAVVTYATSHKGTTRQSLLRKITAIRSMMMLSSPVTWLRNKVSNFMLKRINKLASAIGNKVWSKADGQNQLKLDGKVSVRFDKNGHAIFSSDAKITTDVQNFINKNFLDNGFFDTIVSNLSKYDPSDIKEQYKTKAGMPKKEALMIKMVMKAMYNKYYNESTFNSSKMRWLQQQLMKMMSDESYIRESAIRYFGHILAENKYDLSKGVTDAVMNDFSSAVGLALNDYMHSDNFFNTFERAIAAKGTKASEVGLFAYKLILPFASASWNWFKAAINMSPIGLVKSIAQLSRLEKNIQQAEIDFAAGKSNLDPRLKAYMLKRNFGQGVIGTILLGLGALLAGLGHIRLDEDDYGTPKLHIGNITIDVSSIFGSSSLLAGAALVAGWKQGDFMNAMNAMIDFALEDMPLMDIVQMDMYSNGGFSIGLDQLESIALSFIPNMLSWIAGATYSGEVKYSSNKGLKFLERAAAKIPFLGNFLNKKVNPYTGKTGSYIKAINRFVPYFSIDTAEDNELKSQALGLNKSMLNGKYTIEGESFNVKGKLLTATNQAYGQWNAKDLGDFYTDNFRVTIKVGNRYKSLLYSQMTDEQRKTAVQTIMSNNAELAKIYAWTQSGHKYYASSEIYQRLRKYGIKTNVYIGNQGFKK